MNLALALEGRAKPDAEAKPLVAIADMLAALPDPEIDESFAAALEARLMVDGLEEQMPVGRPQLTVVRPEPAKAPEAPAEPLAPVVTLPKRRFVVRRTFAAAIAAALALGAIPAMAAVGSLPGSPFYGLKLQIERTQLAMFGTPLEDGFTKMKFAQRRVDEAAQLAVLGGDPGRVISTLELAEQLLRDGKQLVLSNTTDPVELSTLASMARKAEAQIRAIAPEALDARVAVRSAIDMTQLIQSDVARMLGIEIPVVPAADKVEPVIEAPAAPAPKSLGSSGGQSASQGPAPKGDEGRPSKAGDAGGSGKMVQGPPDGCEVIGSRDGLGDIGAFATRLTCQPS